MSRQDLKLFLLGLAGTLLIGSGAWLLIDMLQGPPAQEAASPPVVAAPETAVKTAPPADSARAGVEETIANAPEIARFFDRLRLALPSDYESAVAALAARRSGGATDSADYDLSQAVKTLRQSRGALAAKADVVIENFKLGGLKKFGLDYDSLAARNPRLGDNYGKGPFPTFDIRNNVMYDYGGACTGNTQGRMKVNYVGNYVRPGPSSRARKPITVATADGTCPVTVAIPEGEGPWPAVIMYPDAGGVRDALRDMATRLAGLEPLSRRCRRGAQFDELRPEHRRGGDVRGDVRRDDPNLGRIQRQVQSGLPAGQ